MPGAKRESDSRKVKGRRRNTRSSSVKGLESALAAAVRRLCREMYGPAAEDLEVPLELRAVVGPAGVSPAKGEPALKAQIESAVREAGAKVQVYRAGHVFCYRCESSSCDHSVPPSPTTVFGGYSATGVPQWPEFVQLLIEVRHPRTDLLFEPSTRSLAAAYIAADTLKERQLGIFGRQSKTYDILAQVIFGFVTLSPPGGGEREKAAITLQAVGVRLRPRRPRIVLNVLGRLSDGSEAYEALDGPFQLRIVDSVVTARRLVGRNVDTAGAERTMRRAAGTLDRLGRQSGRRTAHAEMRRRDSRPTAKALEDVLEAQESALLWDERHRTVVVLGARNRVHVFSQEGRHITSLNLTKEEIERRRRRRRWRDLGEERRRVFVAALREES